MEKIIKNLVSIIGRFLVKLGVDERSLLGYKGAISFILKHKKVIERGELEFQFSQSFAKYFYSPKYKEKLKSLINGLDEESKKIILDVINKYIYILHNNILDIDEFFDEINKETIIKNNRLRDEVFKKYWFPFNYYKMPVFYYKNGLKFIPENILKNYIWKSVIDCGAFIGDSVIMFN